MHRRQDKPAGLQIVVAGLSRGAPFKRLSGQLEDVVHWIADKPHPLRRHAFAKQVGHSLARTSQTKIRQMIGDHAVHLLGHGGPAIQALPSFYMDQRHVGVRGHNPGRESRIGIPVYEDRIGDLGVDNLAQRRQHLADLINNLSRTDAQTVPWRLDAEFAEKHIGKHRIVVLAGVDHDTLKGRRGSQFTQSPRGNAKLDELRPVADNCKHLGHDALFLSHDDISGRHE